MSDEDRSPRGADEEYYFVENMARWREEKGWTQSDLAREVAKLGWTAFRQTTISRIEKHERPVRLGEAQGIAGALGASLELLLSGPGAVQNLLTASEAERKTYAARSAALEAIADWLHEVVKLTGAAEALRATDPSTFSPEAAEQKEKVLALADYAGKVSLKELLTEARTLLLQRVDKETLKAQMGRGGDFLGGDDGVDPEAS